jgi:hypothetical protein
MADTVEFVVISGLKRRPFVLEAWFDFISHVGDEVFVGKVDDHGLVIHHGPMAFTRIDLIAIT